MGELQATIESRMQELERNTATTLLHMVDRDGETVVNGTHGTAALRSLSRALAARAEADELGSSIQAAADLPLTPLPSGVSLPSSPLLGV